MVGGGWHFQVLHFHVFYLFWSPIFRSWIFSPPISSNDHEHVLHVALSTGIIFTRFRVGWSTYLLLTFNVFTADTLRCAVTWTFNPLILNVCSASVSREQTPCQIWAKSNCTRAVSYSDLKIENLGPSTMLDLWLFHNFVASWEP